MKEQVKQITKFYEKFTVRQIDEETQIIRSPAQNYLVKMIKLEKESSDVDSVVQTLQQYLALSDQFILTLMHYDMQTTQTHIFIRSIYQYSHLTLKDQIQHRAQKLLYFHANQLWMIAYAIIRALEYLQRLNIAYGVLGCDKIFVGDKIKLLDPSAIAEDPLVITNNRLHSPEILLQYTNIDIIKSDVFIFGLCMLQAALLIDFSVEFGQRIDKTRIKLYLETVEQIYDSQFTDMLRLMLESNPQFRPSFSQIRQFLESTLQLSPLYEGNDYSPLPLDEQDEVSPFQALEQTIESENIDTQDEQIHTHQSVVSEFQKAKLRYLTTPEMNQTFSYNTQSSNKSQNSSIMHERDTVKIQKRQISKNIKEKLVKKMDSSDLQVVQYKQYDKGDGIFTNPKLMADIKNQLQFIAKNRSQMRSKQNICRN